MFFSYVTSFNPHNRPVILFVIISDFRYGKNGLKGLDTLPQVTYPASDETGVKTLLASKAHLIMSADPGNIREGLLLDARLRTISEGRVSSLLRDLVVCRAALLCLGRPGLK